MGDYSDRLNRVIPGGAHTYSRGDDQYPSNAPEILARGQGAYVFDSSENRYLDYGMALRAVTLGYADPRVNAAAIRQIERGVNLTRPSMIELEAAEALVDLIPGAEMVKFAKTGSNVTTAAVKIARAVTGRPYVCIPRQHPFFSFDDWFIGTTPLKRGIPPVLADLTLVFDYGDIASLERLFADYPDQIACVLMEPATTVSPCPAACTRPMVAKSACGTCLNKGGNFLHRVRELTRKAGALFVLDEMITGFRWHLQGAQTYFDVEPDLSTFGKGMANGFALAALAGKREFMDVGGIRQSGAERVFLMSSTHGAEMVALGALLETIRIYREEAVTDHLWSYGARLFDGINGVSRSLGLIEHFHMDGLPISMNYLTKDRNGVPSLALRTLFSQEMIGNGVLMPWIAVSQAHGDRELEITLAAVERALRVYAGALEDGVERHLRGPAIKPVFRQFN
ncbi:MAG: glutamate-1-semialdehyde 2,1-aminomutase [Rhodospirillaceae bacterium]